MLPGGFIKNHYKMKTGIQYSNICEKYHKTWSHWTPMQMTGLVAKSIRKSIASELMIVPLSISLFGSILRRRKSFTRN